MSVLANPLNISEKEFDELPFGIIRINRAGKILHSYEEQLTGRKKSDVLGKDFFTEVAPCTHVADFRGRLLLFSPDNAVNLVPSDVRGPSASSGKRPAFIQSSKS